ncbi:MAG TPA: ATP-binding protein [Pseudonocardia sp.]|uniref:ATP-binding protein n=1 Tax=Pseudonocardia sp. TaxID=60912 RepID=UPI002C9B4348|nr:ATP-binding protein [Pseudonocardia sp.]HTF49692.1 ATP-binding protein [Pseudonocardia sp.]
MTYLPRGNLLDDAEWMHRHRLLQWVLGLHLPALFVFGLALHHDALTTTEVLIPPLICLLLGRKFTQRRPASIAITAGLTYCSAALVGLSRGSIEAHFHFFIIIGFIALYQDWVPFLWNVAFVVLSHGIGSAWRTDLIFGSGEEQRNAWLWSGIHGIAVLAACVGMVLFWRVSEDEQVKRTSLTKQLSEADRRRFTSHLLVNLARRNQSMLYRQLDIINQLENNERDPDVLADLFQLDHLATRVRRNAESLLVLSGEQPARVWRAPVPLHEVVRAAIAETEDLERVDIAVDENVAVSGQSVTDLTHLLAELTENAVRFSPPNAGVTIRGRAQLSGAGGHLLTIEDWGVGMPPDVLAAYNQVLVDPPDVDLAVPQQLGFHVVARLARRHGIEVSITRTPGGGVTAAVMLPARLVVTEGVPDPADLPPTWEYHRPGPAAASRPRRSGGRSWKELRDGPVLEAEWVAVPTQGEVPAIEATGRPVAASGWAGARAEQMPSVHPMAEVTPGWSGWWSHNEPADQAPGPVAYKPLTQRRSDPEVGNGQPSNHNDQHSRGVSDAPDMPSSPAGPRLNRRVPQSHLTPELLLPVEKSEPAERTAHLAQALTQYQASRNAASVEAEGNGTGDGFRGAMRPGVQE